MRERARCVAVTRGVVGEGSPLAKLITRLRCERQRAKHRLGLALAELAIANEQIARTEREIGRLVARARREGVQPQYFNDDLQPMIGDGDDDDREVAS